MKNNLLEKFKGALISNEEAKTIFGGYNMANYPGGCNYPLCVVSFYYIPVPACDIRPGIKYCQGNTAHFSNTSCVC